MKGTATQILQTILKLINISKYVDSAWLCPESDGLTIKFNSKKFEVFGGAFIPKMDNIVLSSPVGVGNIKEFVRLLNNIGVDVEIMYTNDQRLLLKNSVTNVDVKYTPLEYNSLVIKHGAMKKTILESPNQATITLDTDTIKRILKTLKATPELLVVTILGENNNVTFELSQGAGLDASGNVTLQLSEPILPFNMVLRSTLLKNILDLNAAAKQLQFQFIENIILRIHRIIDDDIMITYNLTKDSNGQN